MLRTAQIPLFCIADKLGDAKHELQTMVEACGAVVADLSDEQSSRVSYGPKRFPFGIRPLISEPVAEVPLVSRFKVNDLGLDGGAQEFGWHTDICHPNYLAVSITLLGSSANTGGVLRVQPECKQVHLTKLPVCN